MRKVKNYSIDITHHEVQESISEHALFVKSFCNMDIDYLVDLLDEAIDYGEENKWSFIEGLRNRMEFFKLRKDTYFIYTNGICLGCNTGFDILVFKGNYSNVEWSFRLDIDDGKITSVYECSTFKSKKVIDD